MIPLTDDRLTIDPPRSFMTRTAWRQPKNTPSRLTAIVRCQSSSEMRSMSPTMKMPALFTKPVEPPKARANVVDGLRPARVARYVEPHEVQAGMLARGAFAGSGVDVADRDVRTTREGALRRRQADPAWPPVMSTVLPASRPSVIVVSASEVGNWPPWDSCGASSR